MHEGERGLTQIKATHESDLGVYDAELLVVGPVKNDVVTGAVERLQGVVAQLGQAEAPEGEVSKAGPNIGLKVFAAENMVGVPKHPDVGVQRLECVLGVLQSRRCQ